ncbi:MAG TPA: peptide deformylase [Micromonosporaceae bacterium]|nr:peptide deformylase [Micromonosporaceae bacterium]
MTVSPLQRAVDDFASELTRWRVARGLTKKSLANRMNFDPSYVSHVEARRHRPTADFARRAEMILEAGGAIWQHFQEYDRIRTARPTENSQRGPTLPRQWLPPGTGLIVEREDAALSYQDNAYRCVVRRSLYNAGTEPVTRYVMRVAIDRYPHDPERSNRYHRSNPLFLEELDLRAHCDGPAGREPMTWRLTQDRDAFKEVWLLFENHEGRFPLYPGERATIEYSYQVGRHKWGQWFQRAVRLPTRHLAVRLDLPADLKPQVWGVETSLSAEEAPLRTPIVRRHDNDRAVFEWSTPEPALNARYRLEWRFRVPNANGSDEPNPVRASDRMRGVGILQRGAELLREPARQFRLPRDEAIALNTVARLRAVLERLDELHLFTKGLGIAAPQIGLPWAAALVRPPQQGTEPLVLLNPRIVDTSEESDEQYEGCLSFFDVRGAVPRPLRIDVEHARWDGERVTTRFERAMARLVAHEIDHLNGKLYVDRMAADAPLIPVEDYRGTGRPWHY